MPDGNTGMFILACLLCAVSSYLLGSINFAVIVSRTLFDEDVRTKGSGNAGMTNILRSYGKKGAALTLLGDTGKGILAVWVGRWIFMWLFSGHVDPLYGAYIAAICAILGHTFPVFFGFKGGKGVATSGGVILALQPVLAILLLSLFIVIVLTTKIVSLGSVLGMSMYPIVTFLWCYFYTKTAVVYCTICAVIISGLVVWMHRANIKRILNGTEYKFGSKPKDEKK